MLKELQRLFLIEAVKYNVLPLDNRRVERILPDMAGRPTLIKGNSQLLFSGMGRLERKLGVINLKNRSHAVTAEVVLPDSPANGVIIAQGGDSAAGRSTRRMASSSTATTCSASAVHD